MAPESVSFRITRSTEDLAQTIHSLSHRLVRLEQKLAALELSVEGLGRDSSISAEEHSSLDNVERLLHDCRSLLNEESDAHHHEPFAEDRFAA